MRTRGLGLAFVFVAILAMAATHAEEALDALRASPDDQALLAQLKASVAKIHATEAARKVTIDGMQVLGGYGYMMEYDMQRYVRNALLGTIGGGTNQIQRLIIAKLEGMM